MAPKRSQNQATKSVDQEKPTNQWHGDSEGLLAYLTTKVEGVKYFTTA